MQNRLVLVSFALILAIFTPRSALPAEATAPAVEPSALHDLRTARPLVVHVTVPLCCFRDGERERDERISIAGYAGHNRLMDGTKLPSAGRPAARGRAIPSFVLACYSESYLGPALREAGSRTLLMTRSLMAPEGYVLEAVVSAIGENGSQSRINERAVSAYAKWQNLARRAAGTIFAPPLT